MDKKLNIDFFKKAKKNGNKISAITAYDYNTAKLASEAGIELILVGDSLGMVVQGHRNTIPVTMDQMIYHTKLVSRANPDSFIVGDMPYGSYQISPEESLRNAVLFIKEGGAQAIKLEGGRERFNVIKAILEIDIPVMGHLGLTPQSLHKLGGFKVQGKLKDKADRMIEDAKIMEQLGVFSIILEAIPKDLAKVISESISIPTIGIGAGPYCDGQILVFNDLVGLSYHEYIPKFVRRYANTGAIINKSIREYIKDIKTGNFPASAETYSSNSKK
jgi:3-methyl-2-oxobutanoate hydroxymethyltransferase